MRVVQRDPRRLIAFTDGVVAIALTLLVLPLVDVAESLSSDQPIDHVLEQHAGLLGSFFLTFALVARLWWVHYQVFEMVASYDAVVVLATLGWLLSIVVLPFAARLVGVYGTSRGAFGLYVGTLVVSSALLAVIARQVVTKDYLMRDGGRIALTYRWGPLISTAGLALSLIVGLAYPPIGYYFMLLLLTPQPVLRAWMRRRDQHDIV